MVALLALAVVCLYRGNPYKSIPGTIILNTLNMLRNYIKGCLILQQKSGVGFKPLFYYPNIPTHNLPVIYNH